MGEECACPHAVTAALIKDYYIHYFRLYLLLIYHYTLSIPGYGNNIGPIDYTRDEDKIYFCETNKHDCIFKGRITTEGICTSLS